MDLVEKAYRDGLKENPFCTYSREVTVVEAKRIEDRYWERWEKLNRRGGFQSDSNTGLCSGVGSGESVGLQDGGEVEPIRIGVEEKDFIEMLNVIHRLIEPKSVYCENREEQLDETIQSMIKNAHLIKEILDRTWPHYVLGGEF